MSSRLPARVGGLVALVPMLILAGCFNGATNAEPTTTPGTLSSTPISIASPADSLVDPVLDATPPTDSPPATDPPTETGSCTVTIAADPSGDDITWSDSTDSSGLTYGGWFTPEQIAVAAAEGTPIDRQQFSLVCIGGGGQVVSLVGTNLIPNKPADYPVRTSPTGGQSALDKVQLSLVTAAADPADPRNRTWLVADTGTFTISEFDDAHIVAEVQVPVVALDGSATGTLRASFDYRRP